MLLVGGCVVMWIRVKCAHHTHTPAGVPLIEHRTFTAQPRIQTTQPFLRGRTHLKRDMCDCVCNVICVIVCVMWYVWLCVCVICVIVYCDMCDCACNVIWVICVIDLCENFVICMNFCELCDLYVWVMVFVWYVCDLCVWSMCVIWTSQMRHTWYASSNEYKVDHNAVCALLDISRSIVKIW